MADIELVIKIPENVWNAITGSYPYLAWEYVKDNIIMDSVRSGTLLPKGHGRLGDLDALRKEVSLWGMNDYEPLDFVDAIDQADTIIEVDKSESEG